MDPCYACPRPNIRVPPVEYDGNTVVVAIDGACRDNGLASARGSIGVFYGPGSERNRSSLLTAAYQQTNQVAELYAAISVLREAKTKTKPWDAGGSETCKILIMTDSAYLVNGISDHIWKWKANGYRTAQNRPIANLEMWLELDEMMLDFEANDIDVWFWHVRREFNRDADRLANEAFDEIGQGVRLEVEFIPWE